MKTRISLKYYLLTLFFIATGGCIFSFLLAELKDDNHLLLLGLVMTGFAVIICAILNLLYFLPETIGRIKFLLPGILTFVVITVIFDPRTIDWTISAYYAVIELVAGIVWILRKSS